MVAQPLPIPGQSWPVLPPGVSYAKGLPVAVWPTMPGESEPAGAEPLAPLPAPIGLGRYLVLGLRQTALGLARAWQSFSPAASAPAPSPPGVGAGAATPESASQGEPHA